MNRRGTTLLEVLCAAVLLAAVSLACLPLLRLVPKQAMVRPSHGITHSLLHQRVPPPNATIFENSSVIGEETEGVWRVMEVNDVYSVMWIVRRDRHGAPL